MEGVYWINIRMTPTGLQIANSVCCGSIIAQVTFFLVAGGDFRGAGQFFLMSYDLPILRHRDRLVDRGDRLVDHDRRIEHPCAKWSVLVNLF